ncbi:NTP transferase domain-containing protein [Luteolibacter arcticus]|uniref:NTP transferase domain-containing protein n=1 Tax=Luteolibacter arcticus TaxID=1581411 RepID=A0ABT3GCQ4_9BACT|nr:NTP transferase domain-containing protein [Luteolibacter arcticus]MCW1921415.1 NTP transferase domain-containing protein [Luteolibacter arcticus]
MTTLILIGGKSQRMGRDKATIERPDGILQIDWLARLAKLTGGEVFLSMRDDSAPPVDLPVVTDEVAGGGPLAALAAIHARKPDGPVLVLGCDLFLLDETTVTHLLSHRDPNRSATCFANRIDGRPEPLCAIYEVSGISQAAEALGRGDHCARRFLESLDPLVLELPHAAALDNANTPQELAECFAKLQHGVMPKIMHVLYFAKLRESRGLDEEQVETLACTPAGLYEELRFRHRLPLEIGSLRAARNGDFCTWDDLISDGDEIVFIPPVAGG